MGENTSELKRIIENTTAGGITINDIAVHYGGIICKTKPTPNCTVM